MAIYPSRELSNDKFCRQARHHNILVHLQRLDESDRWYFGRFCLSFHGMLDYSSLIGIQFRPKFPSTFHFLFDSLAQLTMTIGSHKSDHFLLNNMRKEIIFIFNSIWKYFSLDQVSLYSEKIESLSVVRFSFSNLIITQELTISRGIFLFSYEEF
jgi:hypothetical protein